MARAGNLLRVGSWVLACVGGLGLLAGCTARRSEGAQCSFTSDCVSPLVCSGGACRNQCSSTRDCVVFNPAAVCTADNVCVAPSDAGPAGDAGDASDASPVEAGGPTPCDSVREVVGTGDPAGQSVHGDTSDSPSAGALSFTSCSAVTTPLVYQQAFRYQMHGDGFLLVDSAAGGTSRTYDTYLAFFDRCAADGVPSLCNDDYESDVRARITTDHVLFAGSSVLLGMASYATQPAGLTNRGGYELVFRELPAVAAGASCDVTGAANRCASGACGVTRTGQGVCLALRGEHEPNALSSPELLAPAPVVVVSGVCRRADPEDCFAVDVPAGGSLVATLADERATCATSVADGRLALVSPAGAELATSDGSFMPPWSCPVLDGTSAGPAHALAAGRYTVCVRNTPVDTNGQVETYVLSLALLAP